MNNILFSIHWKVLHCNDAKIKSSSSWNEKENFGRTDGQSKACQSAKYGKSWNFCLNFVNPPFRWTSGWNNKKILIGYSEKSLAESYESFLVHANQFSLLVPSKKGIGSFLTKTLVVCNSSKIALNWLRRHFRSASSTIHLLIVDLREVELADREWRHSQFRAVFEHSHTTDITYETSITRQLMLNWFFD